MSLNVTINASGMDSVFLHLERLPAELRIKLREIIARVTLELLSRVRAAEPVRTGRLRSATKSYLDDRQRFVRGRVRIRATGKAQDVAAAFGALEYGAPGKRRSGPVAVSAYTRDRVRVRSYRRRRPRLAARRFLRGPAADMRPIIMAQLQAAIAQAINRSAK